MLKYCVGLDKVGLNIVSFRKVLQNFCAVSIYLQTIYMVYDKEVLRIFGAVAYGVAWIIVGRRENFKVNRVHGTTHL